MLTGRTSPGRCFDARSRSVTVPGRDAPSKPRAKALFEGRLVPRTAKLPNGVSAGQRMRRQGLEPRTRGLRVDRFAAPGDLPARITRPRAQNAHVEPDVTGGRPTERPTALKRSLSVSVTERSQAVGRPARSPNVADPGSRGERTAQSSVDESLLIKAGGAPDLDVLRAARWTQARQMIFLGLPTDRELWRVFYRS
jgi:hypothetical protein